MDDSSTAGSGRDDSDAFATVARAAATDAGAYLRERFADGALEADYGAGDVKTAADRGAEQRVLAVLREAYPGHAVSAEESGEHEGNDDADSDYRWVVDALDGTNNFAAGVPTFGVAVTLLDGDGPVVTAVTVPVLEDTYLARRGGGVTYNGRLVTADGGDAVPPSHATVASVIGAPVLADDALSDQHREQVRSVRGVCKRVVETWAPVVYWGLLARGRVDGYVTFHPDEREQVAGELLAGEAGCHRRMDGPLTVFARDERTLAALWDALQ
jgi:myo-inositol-1(or 4)-monophosphatase